MALQSEQVSALSWLDRERASDVLEQSITWEDDVWKADPFDVDGVHREARQKFASVLGEVAGGRSVGARMLLFHGQSGAGKTHLIRALRCSTHRTGVGYFGYAQMTPDVANYAEYYLRRLVNALEKPYDPDGEPQSGLHRLADLLVAPDVLVDTAALERLREADLQSAELAALVAAMADDVVSAPAFLEADLDINIVRALLYLHRADPRVDQRVRQYLYGRALNPMSYEIVSALDPNEGEDRAFEIIESLGRLMHAAGHASLVFCIDQVEDLRFYDDAEDRFQRAIRDLIQIANRVPTAIVVISILGDFYNEVRNYLPQSFIDRIEKAGPVLLRDARDRTEAEQIIGQRLRFAMKPGRRIDDPAALANAVFDGGFFGELAGLSTRKMLEATQARWRTMNGEAVVDTPTFGAEAEAAAVAAMPTADPSSGESNGSSLRAFPQIDGDAFARPETQTGTGSDFSPAPMPAKAPMSAEAPETYGDLGDMWDRLSLNYHAEIPDEESDLAEILCTGFSLLEKEAEGRIAIEARNLGDLEGVHAIDLTVAGQSGDRRQTRVFLCNKGSQGGALKRQIERVLHLSEGHTPLIVRTSDFPPNGKNATSQLVRRYQMTGGQKLVVPSWEWDRMLTLVAFRTQQQRHPAFAAWLAETRMLHDLPAMQAICELRTHDLTAPLEAVPAEPPSPANAFDDVAAPSVDAAPDPQRQPLAGGSEADDVLVPVDWGGDYVEEEHFARVPVEQNTDSLGDAASRTNTALHAGDASQGSDADRTGAPTAPPPASQPAPEDRPDPFIDDEERFQIGHRLDGETTPIALSRGIFRRHAAMLGGSGSGKTTLAISVIEQLLLRGIPAILIDRKGDLCSYANPDVWRPVDG
ncbi:MAG: AAA family ATPase, partial [Pseudomonadota bacterium]